MDKPTRILVIGGAMSAGKMAEIQRVFHDATIIAVADGKGIAMARISETDEIGQIKEDPIFAINPIIDAIPTVKLQHEISKANTFLSKGNQKLNQINPKGKPRNHAFRRR